MSVGSTELTAGVGSPEPDMSAGVGSADTGADQERRRRLCRRPGAGMSRVPIRLRLTLAFAVAMAAVLAAMGVFVYLRVGATLLASVDQTLRSQSAEAVSHVRRGERGLVDRDVAGGTILAQLLDRNGAVVESSPATLAPLLSPGEASGLRADGTLLRSVTLRLPNGDWRLRAVRSARAGGILVVARSLEPREESLHRLLRELLVAGPLALLLASFAGYGLAAAALRPVEAMRRRAAAVTASTPGRLPVPRSRDEIARLAMTLNEMLGRLEESLEHERRFVADASHELRTPLSLLRVELEIALRRPRTAAELEATVRSAAEEAERLSRLAEDMLLIARADRGTIPLRRRRVAADDVLGSVDARFRRQAESRGVSIRTESTDELLEADAERIEQALGNLVDNALAHGARSVDLRVERREGSVELHVLDDGPGFPEAFLSRAFDRFSRADEARTGGGTGLGLSIVALIARAHGGDAGAANRAEGGADVWITLPVDPTAAAVERAAALT